MTFEMIQNRSLCQYNTIGIGFVYSMGVTMFNLKKIYNYEYS